jgi:hypothetical protein
MKLIKDPPVDIFKLCDCLPPYSFDAIPTADLPFRLSYVPDVKAFVDSPAKKPGDTMLCDGKLVRDKPMYRPEYVFSAFASKHPAFPLTIPIPR